MEKIEPYLLLFDLHHNGVDAIILWVMVVSMTMFLLYHLIIFSRLIFHKSEKEKVEPDPVSVIIASRDDAIMLKQNLPLIMAQKEITYEVIVVDDCSYDDTVDVFRKNKCVQSAHVYKVVVEGH